MNEILNWWFKGFSFFPYTLAESIGGTYFKWKECSEFHETIDVVWIFLATADKIEWDSLDIQAKGLRKWQKNGFVFVLLDGGHKKKNGGLEEELRKWYVGPKEDKNKSTWEIRWKAKIKWVSSPEVWKILIWILYASLKCWIPFLWLWALLPLKSGSRLKQLRRWRALPEK